RWIGDNNRGSGMQSGSVLVENVFEELDAPNEWFYDNETGNLYFYPDETTDLSSAKVEASVNTELVKIKGESVENPVKDVTFDGFDYFGTKRTMFTIDEPDMNYIPLMRGDWCVVRAGCVYTENTENIKIVNSEFTDMGGNVIFMYGYNKDNLVDNNEMINMGASGVQVVGKASSCWEPSFWAHDLYNGTEGFTVHKTSVEHPDQVGPKTEDYPRDITISNNHIENIGIFEKQSTGVNLSVSARVHILHNTIHKSARSNINVNDGTFGGHEIAYNDVYDSQRETSDHGPFNSWGRDRFWSVPRYNASGQSGDLLRHYTVDGVEYDLTGIDHVGTTTIHDNRFHHSPKAASTWGIDLDDGSSDYEIYNNLCLGMGIKLREGFDRKVYNNILLDGPLNIHVSYKEANDEVYGNIVAGSTPWNLIGADMKAAQYKVDNNLYFDFGGPISFPSQFNGWGFDANSLTNVDPQFENARQNNYTVTNQEAMDAIGFVNFPMDQFGKPGCEHTSPLYAKT
ncbi:MAG: right-handed parallel beta-helix repeat-containing protein, partial [Massilioclostridium sp.]|nr:right-handed parallel beta-helix repeat-containing protein [Massilioclostridium sp.]